MIDFGALLRGSPADAGDANVDPPGYRPPLGQGTGALAPGNRASAGNRPEQTGLEASLGFDALNGMGHWEPPASTGGPYTVKGGSLYGVKRAAHAHDRIEERTPFPRGEVDRLQGVVDAIGLRTGSYYLPLRDAQGRLHGYAAFKTVPNRRGPVLATVLGPDMQPRGTNLASLVKAASEPETNTGSLATGLFTTDQRDTRNPGALSTGVRQPIAGNALSENDVAAKLFNDLKMNETCTIDDSSAGFPPGGLGA